MNAQLYPCFSRTLVPTRFAALLVWLLAGVSMGSLAQSGAVSVTQSFSYTGQIVTYTVPSGVTSLTIEARGAEGGFGDYQFGGGDPIKVAGKGALITGIVSVSGSQMLKILVGQKSPNRNGGGGGSFVTTAANAPLIIAGGGGGSGTDNDLATKDGQAGRTGGNNGGSNGNGGPAVNGAAAGGGGLLTDGGSSNTNGGSGTSQGGKAFVNGGAGSTNNNSFGLGGFGGGGSGTGTGAGGGGGGYSGGGGASNGPGGGGGSFNSGTSLSAVSGANSGNGLVTIRYVPTIRYVKTTASGTGDGSSWNNANSDLQTMIDAQGVQQVWVAGGRYTTTQNNGSFVMRNNVAIYGGFSGNETDLSQRPAVNPVTGSPSSSTLTTSPNRSVVSNRTNGLDNSAVLDGVVITGSQQASLGGGVVLVNSYPTLSNCLITGNSAEIDGGGLFIAGPGTANLLNCVISSNTARQRSGGGLTIINSTPRLTNCIIENNSTQGVLGGGGIENEDNANSTFINCIIRANSSRALGGGISNYDNARLVLINCLISNNSAITGGGIYSRTNSSATLINCTLTANRATSTTNSGAAIYNDNSQVALSNTVLWNNQEATNQAIVNQDANSGVTGNYCLVGTGESDYTSSPTNLTATSSPFVGGTNYQLNPCSVAINAGDPGSNPINNGTTDLAGAPRFYGGRIDIGAYEYQGSSSVVAIISQPPSGSSVTAGGTVSAAASVSGSVSSYQWYKNSINSPISGQTSATLTLTNVQLSDAGSYSVVINGTCNSVTSTAFNLTVSQAVTPNPTLTSPANGTTTNGIPTFAGTAPTSSTVTVLVNGTSPQTLTVVATNNSYSVSPTSPLASGSYAAYATAQLGGQTTSPASNTNSFTVDNTAPGVLLTASVASGATTMSQPTIFTVSFSEPVTGFDASKISITNGNASGVTGSGASYSFNVTATNPGQVTVSIPANVAQDGVGNGNTASNAYSYTYQRPMTGMPTLSSPASGTVTNNNQPTYSGSAPTGSAVTIFVNNSTLFTAAASGNSFSLTQPTTLSDGTYQVYVTAQLPGQTTSSPSGINSFTIDATAPSVLLSSTVAQGATTMSSPVSLTATFSEAVKGLSPSGISVTGGSVSNLAGSGTTYSFDITPSTNFGPVAITIPANAARDGAGNGNTGSSAYFFVYEQSATTPPSIAYPADGAFINSRTPTYRGNAPSGSTVKGYIDGNLIETVIATNGQFSLYSPTPLSEGIHQVYVTAQLPGQAVSSSPTTTFTTDFTPPTASFSSTQVVNGGTTSSRPVSLTINFSEPVYSFNTSDLLVSNATVDAFSGSGDRYLLSVRASENVPASISIVENGATDKAGNGNLVASFNFTYQPAPTPPTMFTITGAQITSCTLDDPTKSKRYRVSLLPQYQGQNTTQPTSFSVANELSATAASGPYTVYLWGDNQQITLVAKQPASAEARFAYRWQADCPAISGTPPNQPQPPTTSGIPSQSATVNQSYRLDVTPYFSDPDNQALTYSATGLPVGLAISNGIISGSASQTGSFGISVSATDPDNLSASSSFSLTVGPASPPPGSFTIVGVTTVRCEVITAAERRLTFAPQYAGQSGDPVSFSVVNEKLPTTDAGPYQLRLYTDNPVITLAAQQGGRAVTYRYEWLTACRSNSRQGLVEELPSLVVTLLGNPVMGETVQLEVKGAQNQSLRVELVDMRGTVVHQQGVASAGPVESINVPLGRQTGLLLLRVSTPTERQQLRLLRP